MVDADKKVLCEVYSRVVGYYRPVNQMNKGKQAEFNDRTVFTKEQILKTIEVNNG